MRLLIDNDHFAWFGTTGSKSRLNFLDLLRAAPHRLCRQCASARFMRKRALPRPLIARLRASRTKRFADVEAWTAHLEPLGFVELALTCGPIRIATEGGAVFGSLSAHGLSAGVIVSDDAGQFNVGRHALCWLHAERLVHKLETFTDARQAQQAARDLIWAFYRD